MQAKAAIPVPAHLGRAASEFNFQPAASEPCAAYVYGGRRDKYANPSHVTGTPLRRSDNQIHLGVGPHPVRRGPAGQWLPGQAPVIAPGINRQAGAGEYYLGLVWEQRDTNPGNKTSEGDFCGILNPRDFPACSSPLPRCCLAAKKEITGRLESQRRIARKPTANTQHEHVLV